MEIQYVTFVKKKKKKLKVNNIIFKYILKQWIVFFTCCDWLLNQ